MHGRRCNVAITPGDHPCFFLQVQRSSQPLLMLPISKPADLNEHSSMRQYLKHWAPSAEMRSSGTAGCWPWPWMPGFCFCPNKSTSAWAIGATKKVPTLTFQKLLRQDHMTKWMTAAAELVRNRSSPTPCQTSLLQIHLPMFHGKRA